MNTQPIDLKRYIRSIQDFPKKGILFRDISTLIRNADAWQLAISRMTHNISSWNPDILAAIESRGFLLAAPLASRLGCGFVMIRKPGKLPGPTYFHRYNLEYGQDELHLQQDSIATNQNVVVVDDLLATGGTLSAALSLLKQANARVVGATTLIELSDMGGRKHLGVPFRALLSY